MLKTINEVKISNKRVLVRVDLNVPIINSKIADDTRIRAILPTLKYLVKNKAKVILISHLGDPKGKKDIRYSLKPVAKYLKIKFLDDCLGENNEVIIAKMKPGEIVLLENLRFYAGEEENSDDFAKKLANLADIYINEAFSVSHRNHASLVAITKFLPSSAGFLMEGEVEALDKIFKNPKHPLIAIIGGAKISTKIKVIKNLLKKVDYLLVGGALANNFFKAQGNEVGKSLIEEKMLEEAKNLLKEEKLILPVDVKTDKGRNKTVKEVDKDENILDIGEKTIELFSKLIKKAKMIIWNGPLGLFEKNDFKKGTEKIAKNILANRQAKVIIGGGETIASLKIKNQSANWRTKIKNNVFISTGGGAMLKFLEGGTLPGIKPLIKK